MMCWVIIIGNILVHAIKVCQIMKKKRFWFMVFNPFPMLDIVFLSDSFSKGCGIAWVDYCGILFCNRKVKNVKMKNNLICDSVCFFL
jgi:hypothetical protein